MLNLLFDIRRGRRVVAIGNIELDATLREIHERSNTVTDHPIETGSSITDHVFSEPKRLLIEGEVTDSPIIIFGGALAGGLSERSLEAYEQLVALHEAREALDVVTGYEVYGQMVMTSLIVPREQRTGRRLRFTAEFRHVTTVDTETVPLPPEIIAEEQIDIAQSRREAGRQPVDDLEAAGEAAVVERTNSLLFDLFGVGGSGG